MDDQDVFSKLPLEVIGLVLKKLEDNSVEELKKCKLISPRLYKATQDVFQDEFEQKLCTHFDGSKLNYASSRTFGMNIFGSYKLNFSTVKISRAEYYLMKSWLEKLIPTNIQILELKDNLLNWKEMIEVLSKFSKIVKLKFIQSSDDMTVADKIFKLYSIDDEEFYTQDFFKKMVELIQEKPEFLHKLKMFEAEVIHWNISNILSLFLEFSQCENLEKFWLKIDLSGISKSEHLECYSFSKAKNSSQINAMQMNSLFYFSRFSRSMKSIEIIIDDSKLSQFKTNYLKQSPLIRTAIFNCSNSVMEIFAKENLIQFDQLESLVLKSPLLHCDHFLERNCQLKKFIKKHGNLQNIEISYLDGQIEDKYSIEEEAEFLKSLVIDHHNHNKETRFGYQVGYTMGMESILQFSENLSALKVLLIADYMKIIWKFSDVNIPKYPNCIEIRIENYLHLYWDNYEFESIIEKFQNLEKLIIWSQNWHVGPMISSQDFQLIIGGLSHLKMIYFENSAILTDSALTGLTSEAIEARKENPSEPIGPEDRIGLPISHLKNLESLAIINNDFRLEISDITVHHAFDNMPKLKFLNLFNSKITQEGFETILDKTRSKNLNIVQLSTDIPPAFE